VKIEDLYQPVLYRIHDSKQEPGCFEINPPTLAQIRKEAKHWNSKGWGIFWPVNEFVGGRKRENLQSLRFWYVEVDGSDKLSTFDKIQAGLQPSMIIESRAGFHLYWRCKNASLENYKDILEFRLIPHYGGDLNAKDVSRILRAPGFNHCKDPSNAFPINLVYCNLSLAYDEDVLMNAYPEQNNNTSEIKHKARREISMVGSDLFDKIYSIDCQEALQRLSGGSAVNGEVFSFSRTTNGNMNIIVNNKKTSCWIDQNKRIGSTDKGGPTIWQWINWYQRDHKRTYEIIKQTFPEVFDGN